jgi:hypothetical protein
MQLLQSDTEPEEPDHPDSAVATLRGEMLYYRDQAENVCEKIMELLKTQGSRADMIAMMYKYMNEAKKMAVDVAAKLAPYESPRLEAVEVTQKKITKFVIEAPTLESNPDTWLANAKAEQKLLNKIRQESIDAVVIDNEKSITDGNNNPG